MIVTSYSEAPFCPMMSFDKNIFLSWQEVTYLHVVSSCFYFDQIAGKPRSTKFFGSTKKFISKQEELSLGVLNLRS